MLKNAVISLVISVPFGYMLAMISGAPLQGPLGWLEGKTSRELIGHGFPSDLYFIVCIACVALVTFGILQFHRK